MRIVHIEDFFHPNAGYQVNILSKFQVKQGHTVFVVTSEMRKMPSILTSFFKSRDISFEDKDFSVKTGVQIIRIPLISYISGRSIYSKEIFKVVDSLLPDILYVHGNDTYIGIRYILKSSTLKYPIVFDNHMLEMASRNTFNSVFRFFYKNYIAKIIIKRNIKIIRTVDDPFIENCLGIPLNKSILISFGTDTDLFKPDETQKLDFRKEFSINKNDFVVVYAGKLDQSKGGLFLAKALKDKFNIDNRINIIFLIVGNTVGEYGNRIEEIFNSSENKIFRFPTQKYSELAKFYQAADLAIYPQQCSLSFFDVQACGLPAIVEDNNINFDRVANLNGFTFKAGDTSDFRNMIYKCANMNTDDYKLIKINCLKYIKSKYDYQDVVQKYNNVLQSEVVLFSKCVSNHNN